jgi:putative ABC transport system substrate-binding protein
MNRREFTTLLGGAMVAACPLAARAQRAAVPVVAVLNGGLPESSARVLPYFRDGLRESGYVESRDVAIVARSAEGRDELLPMLAAELVALNVAVIAALGAIAAQAALQATRTIPIVFLTGDPVALGLVTSLSRPGGNATGISILAPELLAKRLELLSELIPHAKSVAFLVNPGNPTAASQLSDLQAAARATRHIVQTLEARDRDGLEVAFTRLAEQRPDALLVAADPFFSAQRDQIVALAARHKLPAIYDFPYYAAAGGLLTYGPNNQDAFRIVGVYVGRILAGTKPADLPVQQPTKFELVINLKTAKALGLTIPPTLLARADEVIE